MINVNGLIRHLDSLRGDDNAAARARLRRGLGHKFGVVEMYPHVVPFLADDGKGSWAAFLVAALFGLHDESPRTEGESLGRAFARIADASGNVESAERRFTALLNAHADDVGEHLRHAVSLARSHGVGIDYGRLLYDLLGWSNPRRKVQLQWARDFWRDPKTSSTPRPEPSPNTETD